MSKLSNLRMLWSIVDGRIDDLPCSFKIVFATIELIMIGLIQDELEYDW